MKRLSILSILLTLFCINGVFGQQTAKVQIIHNSADTAAAGVDIWVNDGKAVENFEFREATSFVSVPAEEDIIISITDSTATDTSGAAFKDTLNLTDGEQYIAMAEGILSSSGYDPGSDNVPFGLQIYSGARMNASQSGNTDLLIHHGATDAPTVDVVEPNLDSTLADDISYPEYNSAGYNELTTDDYDVSVTSSDQSTFIQTYNAPLSTLGWGDTAAVVFASGFLDPSSNSDGAEFALYAALPDGEVVMLPEKSTSAKVQIIHNSADQAAAGVDVWVNENKAVENFEFRNATPFVELPAEEDIIISITDSTATDTSGAAFKDTLNLNYGEQYIAMAEGILSGSGDASFGLQIFSGARINASKSNNTDLLIHHGVTDAPTVDVVEPDLGLTLADDISYPEYNSVGYNELPTDDYEVALTNSDQSSTVQAYNAPLSTLGWDDTAAVVFASGFFDPSNISGGEEFGLYAALPDGKVTKLPLADITVGTGDMDTLTADIDLNGDTLIVEDGGSLVANNYTIKNGVIIVKNGAKIKTSHPNGLDTMGTFMVGSDSVTIENGAHFEFVAPEVAKTGSHLPSWADDNFVSTMRIVQDTAGNGGDITLTNPLKVKDSLYYEDDANLKIANMGDVLTANNIDYNKYIFSQHKKFESITEEMMKDTNSLFIGNGAHVHIIRITNRDAAKYKPIDWHQDNAALHRGNLVNLTYDIGNKGVGSGTVMGRGAFLSNFFGSIGDLTINAPDIPGLLTLPELRNYNMKGHPLDGYYPMRVVGTADFNAPNGIQASQGYQNPGSENDENSFFFEGSVMSEGPLSLRAPEGIFKVSGLGSLPDWQWVSINKGGPDAAEIKEVIMDRKQDTLNIGGSNTHNEGALFHLLNGSLNFGNYQGVNDSGAVFYTDRINLDTADRNLTVAFNYEMASAMDTMHLDVSMDGGETYMMDVIKPWSGKMSMSGEKRFNLNKLAGDTVKLRVRADVSTADSSLSVSNFMIRDAIFDVAVQDVFVNRPCNVPEQKVFVAIKNMADPLDSLPVSYNLDGENKVDSTLMYTTQLSLMAMDTVTFTGEKAADLTEVKDYLLNGNATFPGDTSESNSQVSSSIETFGLPEPALDQVDTSICNGDQITVSVEQQFEKYMWSTGEATQSITIDSAATYKVDVMDSLGCMSKNSGSIKLGIDELPDKPEVITTFEEVCEGDSSELIAPAGYKEYQWTNGDSGRTITVGDNRKYGVEVIDFNGCKSPVSDMKQIKVNPTPDKPQIFKSNSKMPANDTTICKDDQVVLTSEGNYQQYEWSTGDNSRVISVGSETEVLLAVKNSLGCWSEFSEPVKVNVQEMSNLVDKPQIFKSNSKTPANDTTICKGDQAVLTAKGSYQKYEWSTGDKSRSISVENETEVLLAVQDNVGCWSEFSEPVQVNVKEMPTPVIAEGDTTICSGDTATLSTVNDYAGYMWSDGSSDATISVTRANDYFVKVMDDKGCMSDASEKVNISVTKTPSKPSVFIQNDNNNILFTEKDGTKYEWFLNDNRYISGKDRKIDATVEGDYKVKVINNGCESPLSDTLNYTPLAVSTELAEGKAVIYPNPASEQFKVEISNCNCNVEQIDIINKLGKTVISNNGNSGFGNSKTTFSTADLSKGIYSVRITTDKQVIQKRIVVQ